MKKTIRNVLTVFLSVVMLIASMAFSSSADGTETYSTMSKTYSDNGIGFYCKLRYYYNTSNIDVLKKVSVYSDLAIYNSYDLGPFNGAYAYTFNTAEVTYMIGGTARKVSRCDPFIIASGFHGADEYMVSNPLILNSSYVTRYVVAGHGFSTYNSSLHTNDNHYTTTYPKTGEQQINYTTQFWINNNQ